jgi:signal transduction histidine kinase
MRAYILAGLFLIVAISGAQAQAPVQSPFDGRIAEAKAAMMADPAAALAIAEAAEALVPEDGDAVHRVTAQWLQGEALNRLNRSQDAIAVLDRALATASHQAPNTKLRGDLMMARAGAAAMQGDYARAVENFQSAHDVFAGLGEARSQSMALLQLGAIYFDARNYTRALDYYRRAGDAYAGDPPIDLSRYNNVANAQRELKNFAEAEAGFRQALTIAETMDSPMLRARILANIAAVQVAEGRFADADETAKAGLRLNAQGWEPFLWGVRAQSAFARGETQRAADLLARTFAGVDFAQTPMPFREFHRSAYEVYASLGNVALALRHLEAFKRLDDESRDVAASANTALIGAQFDFASQELRITRLRAQTLEAQERQRTLLFFSLFAVALVILCALIFAYATMRRSRNKVRAANVQLSQTNVALEKANKAKSEFLATTSHEIRTPLNGILGMTQVLLSDAKITEGVRERVQIIHGAGETMRAIVDDILDVAKMESGSISIAAEEVAVKRTLEDVCALWRINAEDKSIAFEMDIETAPTRIISDEQRLRQIVFNLLSNAVKFTQAGKVAVRASLDGNVLQIEVADTGTGIPADQLDGIFEAFHQVDGGTTRKFGGTGLGLSICRNLAHAMGGHVAVSSTLGVGSVFTLRLPVKVLTGAAGRDQNRSADALPLRQVLVLENNPFSVCLIEACYTQQNRRIRQVETIGLAQDALNAEAFDEIVVSMTALSPDMADAMGELMALRAASAEARLIVLIGDGAVIEAPAARLCGANKVLVGAFDPEVFLAAIGTIEQSTERDVAA